MPAFVTLEDVSHAYAGAGGAPAVEGLSIAVESGKFAAVVGPSGCGKSTLMKLATGDHAVLLALRSAVIVFASGNVCNEVTSSSANCS